MIENLQPLHVLDYGCGPDVALAAKLHECGVTHSFKLQAYDPAVARFASAPVASDLIVCLDLLDTGDDEAAEETLDDIEDLCDGVAFLAMGSRDERFWLPRIIDRFDLQTYQRMPFGAYAVVYGKPRGVIEGTDGKALT